MPVLSFKECDYCRLHRHNPCMLFIYMGSHDEYPMKNGSNHATAHFSISTSLDCSFNNFILLLY